MNIYYLSTSKLVKSINCCSHAVPLCFAADLSIHMFNYYVSLPGCERVPYDLGPKKCRKGQAVQIAEQVSALLILTTREQAAQEAADLWRRLAAVCRAVSQTVGETLAQNAAYFRPRGRGRG